MTVPRFASKSPKSWPELKTEPCDDEGGSLGIWSVHGWNVSTANFGGTSSDHYDMNHEILIGSAGTRILLMSWLMIHNHQIKLGSMISCMQISKDLVTAHLILLRGQGTGIHENAHRSSLCNEILFCPQSWESKDLTQMCSLSNHST